MIQLQEIRIGNLVFDKKRNRIVTVWGIESNHDKIVVNYAHGSGVYSINLKHIKPIPLTEEWLLDFGFEEKSKSKDFYLGNFRFNILKPANYNGFIFCDGYDVITDRIKYVNQLQNLYFDLKGERLMFKNK